MRTAGARNQSGRRSRKSSPQRRRVSRDSAEQTNALCVSLSGLCASAVNPPTKTGATLIRADRPELKTPNSARSSAPLALQDKGRPEVWVAPALFLHDLILRLSQRGSGAETVGA